MVRSSVVIVENAQTSFERSLVSPVTALMSKEMDSYLFELCHFFNYSPIFQSNIVTTCNVCLLYC